MNKAHVLRTVKETSKGFTLTREQKFQVFVNVCDNLLKGGHITDKQHKNWTNIY